MQPDEEAHHVESSAQRRHGRQSRQNQEKMSDEFMSSSYKRRNQLSNDLGTPVKGGVDANGEAMSEKNQLSDEKESSDAQKDKAAKKFIEGLRKVGPFSKHILNYSYPPLLY